MTFLCRYIQPIYIVCKGTDGSYITPPSNNTTNINSMDTALLKLDFNLRLIQTFYQESLREHGFRPASFRLAEKNDEGEEAKGVVSVDIKILISDLHIDATMGMKEGDLYDYFNNGECLNCFIFTSTWVRRIIEARLTKSVWTRTLTHTIYQELKLLTTILSWLG